MLQYFRSYFQKRFMNNQYYLGAIYDAMRMLGYKASDFYINIKPQVGYESLISGPAFTTYGEVVDANCDYPSLDNIRLSMYKKQNFADRPIVVLQANDDQVAHSGDITSQIYQVLGAVGFVTDGLVRDLDKIQGLKFPIFSKGGNPIDALDYWALTKYQVPVVIGGVKICPGDHIFASMDGVISVKKELLSSMLQKLDDVLQKEEKARAFISVLAQSDSMTQQLEAWVDKNGRW